jgi:hypothetical protein
MEDAVKKFLKRNAFLKPLCIVAFTLLILTDQLAGLTSALVTAFSILLFAEGVLSLKFIKPSLENGLIKIHESDLPDEEKTRREAALKKANTVSSVFNIVIAIAIPVFWFFNIISS